MAVEVAVEGHRVSRGARGQGGRGPFGDRAWQRDDLPGHFRSTGEVTQQFADTPPVKAADLVADEGVGGIEHRGIVAPRSEEHTSELQSLMRNSYAVFFFKKKHITNNHTAVH